MRPSLRLELFSVSEGGMRALYAVMASLAMGSMHIWVCNRGWRSQRQATSAFRVASKDSSSRPYTVVRMPAIVNCFLETDEADLEAAVASGLCVDMVGLMQTDGRYGLWEGSQGCC